MTGTEDSHSSTRPISVAELLARNGTIGAPPVGGRRRRRRGDTDSISVAELTGEIPIVTTDEVAEAETTHTIPAVVEEPETADEPVTSTNGAVEHDEELDELEAEAEAEAAEFTDVDYEDGQETDDDYAGAVADYAAHVEQRDTDAYLDFFAPPRRSAFAPKRFSATGVDAEEMSPDPVEDVDALDASLDVADAAEVDEDLDAQDAVGDLRGDYKDSDDLPSYLRSTAGPLFGGQTVADDVARRGTSPGPEDIDLDESDAEQPQAPMSAFMRGAWVVGQCVLAVAFGAGLFIAFDQLWKWNNIVALVLSVLVILGLVVGVRVVRKTEDIGSTLIAVAVGALVTLGPLALLQSG
jgi:hypothetical protein